MQNYYFSTHCREGVGGFFLDFLQPRPPQMAQKLHVSKMQDIRLDTKVILQLRQLETIERKSVSQLRNIYNILSLGSVNIDCRYAMY